MPPKQISIKVDVNGGTLFLNGSAVTTVYDTRSCAWFKSNDVASALGYANASSSVTKKISPEDRSSFKYICLHIDSSMVDSHARNVFISQKGLTDFLSTRDPLCHVLKIKRISQSLGRSANLPRPNLCSSSDKILPRIVGARTPTVTAITSECVSGGICDQSTLPIDVRRETLFLNGIAVTTVYDTRCCAWFKINDVAEALGYANASTSVSQWISNKDKIAFNDTPIHRDSPQVSAHPRNLFTNQSGLISFLLVLYHLCATHKIQRISLSPKNNQPNVISQLSHDIPGASQHYYAATPRQTQNQQISGCTFFINGHLITLIVDVTKQAWFKVNDIAVALGFVNASTSVLPLVYEMDKNPLKGIAIHKDSPAVNADLRNIFINQKGLIDVLHAKKRETQTAHVSTGLPMNNPAHLNPCDKVVLQAIYSCFKDLNKTSPKLTPPPPTYNTDNLVNTNSSNTKNKGLETLASSNTLMQVQPHNSLTPLSKGLSYHSANAHPYDIDGYWSEGYVIIKMVPNSTDNFRVVQSTDSPDSGSNKNILWKQQVYSAPRLLNLIEHFLSDWKLPSRHSYNLPFNQLAGIVSRICSNFEETLKTIYELTSRMDTSTRTSKNPQPMSSDQLNSLTGSPKSSGEWIYIVSTIPYTQRNLFKVGSTKDRLTKRLGNLNVGRPYDDLQKFVEVFSVNDCTKIDSFIKFFLRPWSLKSEKGYDTEMYMLNFETLCNSVSKIIDYHQNSYQYVVLSPKT